MPDSGHEPLIRMASSLLEREDLIRRQQREIDAMHQRLTWRITSPMRSMAVARLLTRLGWRARPAVGDSLEFQRRSMRQSPVYARNLDAIRQQYADDTIGILVHLHYPELWEPIWSQIRTLPNPFWVHVTATDNAHETLLPQLQDLPNVTLTPVPNVGRDMGPLFRVLDSCPSDSTALLRLHGKRSPHLRDGDLWRDSLVQDLVAAAAPMLYLLNALPRVGVIGDIHSPRLNRQQEAQRQRFNTGWQTPAGFSWNDYRHSPFPVGGMFWMRTQLASTFRDFGVTEDAFAGDEPTARDNQTPHLLERMIGWWPIHLGWDVLDMRSATDLAVLLYCFDQAPEDIDELLAALSRTLTRKGGEGI